MGIGVLLGKLVLEPGLTGADIIAGRSYLANMVSYNSYLGLWSYQYADGHVIGSDTSPEAYNNPDQSGRQPLCVGIPAVPVVPPQ